MLAVSNGPDAPNDPGNSVALEPVADCKHSIGEPVLSPAVRHDDREGARQNSLLPAPPGAMAQAQSRRKEKRFRPHIVALARERSVSAPWTTREVAEYLHVSPETVLRWNRAGKLAGSRSRQNALRFDPDEVRAWLEGTRPDRPIALRRHEGAVG